MRRILLTTLAGASALALHANTAAAQSAPGASAESETLGEIVVTARRRAESLQEVPQTVNAVTADTLQKLNIIQFQDIQTVVPGLTLQQGDSALGGAASLRGVTFQVENSTANSVALYLNDAPAQTPEVFQSLFDVGQIEVLKGPQGTTRGVSAPSGAITVVTHKPDLSQLGGYVDGTLTDLQGRNANGAINIPIVKDVLALRVAGLIDQNDFDGVRSIHNNLRPWAKTSAERVSLSFEPSDVFNANVTYQHLDREQVGFPQVVGSGDGTAINPPISVDQRAAVADQPTTFQQHNDLVTAQVDSRIFGQHLSYVGSYHFFKIRQATESDSGNVLPGGDYFQTNLTTSKTTTQEIRLASDPAPGRFFDYTLGAFYSWSASNVNVGQPASFLSGAFGSPAGAPNASAFDSRFQIPLLIQGPGTVQETSLFGSVTLHLGANTELSGGIRHIASIYDSNLQIHLGDGLIALPASLLGGRCAASTYPGFCDVTLPTGGTLVANASSRVSNRPNIYNVSLSHHFTRDLLVYVNTGTSFRTPGAVPGISGELADSDNPLLRDLSFHPAETSRSYEIGLKSTWLDGRARFNAAVFRQSFHNLAFAVPGINYLDTTTGQATQFGFTGNADVLIQGFDLDGALQITREWNISAQASYAHNQVEGSLIPCNITGANGQPVFNTGDSTNPGLISMCPGGSATQLPLWSLTVQSEYVRPITDKVDGFLRGLLNYYPQNKYVEPTFAADSYSLVNLYAGVRSPDGAWEASIYAKNAFGDQTQLDQTQLQYNLNGTLASFPTLNRSSGYYGVLGYTPRREVGVHVRYAWGSR